MNLYSCWAAIIKGCHENFNPLLPNISMQILHTTPETFPGVLTRRIFVSTVKSFFSW